MILVLFAIFSKNTFGTICLRKYFSICNHFLNTFGTFFFKNTSGPIFFEYLWHNLFEEGHVLDINCLRLEFEGEDSDVGPEIIGDVDSEPEIYP